MPYILIVKKDALGTMPPGPRKLFEEHCREANVHGHVSLVGTPVFSTYFTRQGKAFPKKDGQIPWSNADLLNYADGVPDQDVRKWVSAQLNKTIFMVHVPDGPGTTQSPLT